MKHSYFIPGVRAELDTWDLREIDGRYLVTRVVVAPEERGKGIAKRLLQMACDDADKEGIHLELSVDPYDKSITVDGLCRLYGSFGFVRRTDVYGVVMERQPQVAS